MRRRHFLVAIVGSATLMPRTSRPQTTNQPKVIGFLAPASEEVERSHIAAFRARLGELGLWEERDYRLAVYYKSGYDLDIATRNGRALLSLSPAVIVAGASQPNLAMHGLTASVPVVFVAMSLDPIAAGFAKSLPHPGGNMTGPSLLALANRVIE